MWHCINKPHNQPTNVNTPYIFKRLTDYGVFSCNGIPLQGFVSSLDALPECAQVHTECLHVCQSSEVSAKGETSEVGLW